MANTTHQMAHPEKVRTEILRVKALELRMCGATFRQIGGVLHIDPSTAHDYVKKAMDDLRERSFELAAEVRDLDMARMDSILFELWPQRGNPRTADTILRLLERRAKLVGADAPRRWEGSGPGGNPIQLQATPASYDYDRLSIEELRELERLLEAATPIVGSGLGARASVNDPGIASEPLSSCASSTI